MPVTRIPAPRKLSQVSQNNLVTCTRASYNPFDLVPLAPSPAQPPQVIFDPVTEETEQPVVVTHEPEVEAIPSHVEAIAGHVEEVVVAQEPQPEPITHIVVRETTEVVEIAGEATALDPSGTVTPGWDPLMKKAELLQIALSKGLHLLPTATKTEIINALKGLTASV